MTCSLAVLCSGGDAPGMNAGLRAVVRTLISKGIRVFGVERGYEGLIEGKFDELNFRSMANLIHRGGTFLKTARCPEFQDQSGRKKAKASMDKFGINGIVVLGGDGSLKGLEEMKKEFPELLCLGIPCTIDNDMSYSSNSIGFDTALNTAVSAIDRVRDTANSHERTFVIEVMGRESAFLANHVAIASGAECVVDLGQNTTLVKAVEKIQESTQRGKMTSLVIVLENQDQDAAAVVKSRIAGDLDIEVRSVVLGHLQRGGPPSAGDRILASKMGYVTGLAASEGTSGVVISDVCGKVLFKTWEELESLSKSEDHNNEDLISVLAN